MAIHRYISWILTATYILGTHTERIPGWQPYYLENFRFIPILGDCYQLYDPNESISECRREPDLENQACIEWVGDDHECIGLITPTNETIAFRCASNIRFDNCFEVYDTNQNVTVICQEVFDGRRVGIVTPDNFTVVLYDSFCRTAANVMERQIYANFVDNFSLDAEARSCYKVYKPEETVTPYNCLSKYIYETCVFGMTGGCTALMTQTNEVLVLDCPDKSQRPNQSNCFYLYTPDDEVHTVCQVKIEERCIGVVTPSNFTVLFECFFCSESVKFSYYNHEKQWTYRQFVKKYLENEYLGKNSPLFDLKYKGYNNNLEPPNSFDIYTYWVPKTSCLGITLESNETIILECLVDKEKQEQPGCFQLITEENERQSVCTKVLNEACVGFTTPKNLSVALACYNTVKSSRLEDDGSNWSFFFYTLRNFINYRDMFRVGDYYEIYKESQGNKTDTKRYQVKNLDDQPGCTGLSTESEIIVLSCPENEQNGCFNVIKRSHVSTNETLKQDEKAENVCIKVLDSNCIGIITPDNWILPHSCATHFHGAGAPGSAVQFENTGFISQTIPNKQPIRQRRNV